MGFVYTKDLIGYMNIFESITQVKAKDCYDAGNELIFILKPADMAKAIGKGGTNVKKLANLLRKSIKIVEFNDDPIQFIKNFIKPVEGKIYKDPEGVIAIQLDNMEGRRIVLGREKKNLANMQKIVSNYFNTAIKVV